MPLLVCQKCETPFLANPSLAKCPNCGAKYESPEQLSSTQGLINPPISWQRVVDITFRIMAITAPLIVTIWLYLNLEGSERDGPNPYAMLTGMILVPIGLVAALKGVSFSPESHLNRLRGLYKIAVGIAVIACGAGGSFLMSMVYHKLAGVTVLLTGILFIGLGGVVLGMLEAITGHSLAKEAGLWSERK